MKRVAAVAGALAMVAAAFAYRAATEDERAGGGGTDPGDARVACVRELASVCESLAAELGFDVEVAGYTETLDLLEAAADTDDLELDAWIAPAPVVGMLADARTRAGLPEVLEAPDGVVARSPLVLVTWRDRGAALEGHCGGPVRWSCVGEAADLPWAELGGEAAWGRLKPGHPSPAESSVGLLVAGQAAADRLERTDFASNDLAAPGFRSWFTQLEQTVRAVQPATPGEPVELMVRLGPSTYDVAGATEATAVPLVERSATYRDRLVVVRADPATTVDVVVAPVVDREPGRSVARLVAADAGAEVFLAAGWHVPGHDAPEVLGPVDPLPDGDGTTIPGALTALLSLWEEIT